jgi:chromosome segregation protein
MESDANQREQLLAERDRNRSALDQARQQARHDKDTAHQLAIRAETLRTQLETIVNAIVRLTEQQEQLSLRREELNEALLTNDDPVEELKLQLETQLEKRLTVEEELNTARRLLEEIDHNLRSREQQRSTVDQRVQQVRIALEHERLQNQTLTVQRETVMAQLLEAKFELDAVLATLDESATEVEWQEKLESIDRRIQRLGAINLAAIEEYKSQAERKHYLDAQNEDLVDALNTLENAIRKIDKETRGRFKETFDLINAGFGELFPKIFGGGSAYLEMTGDDLLDTGVSIMARPPGKKNSTIHLLSGGEKALTAIALVFSIFRLNPAPFCILDEVDAPLDDVNVGRYARMVKEMSEKVQFIYITHNKIPMEYASHLLGVTMQEPGVSRLVTVNVEEAAEMALA